MIFVNVNLLGGRPFRSMRRGAGDRRAAIENIIDNDPVRREITADRAQMERKRGIRRFC